MQDSFPLISRPWAEIAKKLGISEDEVLSRLKRLLKGGVVRRVGPILNARKVGVGASTLIAMRVPPGRIREVARRINAFEEVTHNYQRTHEYNLWFTLAAKDEKTLRKRIEEIKKITHIEDILDLPVSRQFKIGVRFEFE